MREHCTSRESKSVSCARRDRATRTIARQAKIRTLKRTREGEMISAFAITMPAKKTLTKKDPQTCSNRHRLLSWRQQLHQILEMDEPNVEARSLNLLMKLVQPLAVRAAPGKHGLRVHHEYRPLHTIGLLRIALSIRNHGTYGAPILCVCFTTTIIHSQCSLY